MEQSQKSPWKDELNSLWNKLAVGDFLATIGIDFDLHFQSTLSKSTKSSNPYQNHTWLIRSHSQLPEGVLHVYPNQIQEDQVIWEEWFLLDGEIRHHVLSNSALENQDGVWQPEPTDTDHPDITLNRSWNYKIEKSLNPFLL